MSLEDATQARGRRVLVVEDGPTITHGGMPYGAGYVAAQALESVTIVDPRESAAPPIAEVYEAYPHIGEVLPAVGYGSEQLEALRETIARSEAEVVIAATPIDLARASGIEKPVLRARYGYADAGAPTLGALLDEFLTRIDLP